MRVPGATTPMRSEGAMLCSRPSEFYSSFVARTVQTFEYPIG
jgi:hypothetical protein